MMKEIEIREQMDQLKKEIDHHEEVIEDSRRSWMKKLSLYYGLQNRLKELNSDRN